eukprot:gene6772-7871_t
MGMSVCNEVRKRSFFKCFTKNTSESTSRDRQEQRETTQREFIVELAALYQQMDLTTQYQKNAAAAAANGVTPSLIDVDATFQSLCLDERILRAIKKLGWNHPTLIQSKSIALSLQGKDILAKARTGSGKTAAYSIPIIQKILMAKQKAAVKGVKAIVLVPTRELCDQVNTHFMAMCFYCSHLVKIVHLGGDQTDAEQNGLLRDVPDVIISTPTRLVKCLQKKSVVLEDTLEMLVVDEADLVLSYGYQEDVNVIKSFLPKVCQSFLMSATLTSQVDELKRLILHTPAILRLEEDSVQRINLSEYSIKCTNFDKFLLVFSLLRLKLMQGKILFFVNDTASCYKLKLFLERFHIKAAVLNSELPINSRHNIILQFNKGIFDYLIATDESFAQTNQHIKHEEEEEDMAHVKVKKEEEEEENEDDEEEAEDDEDAEDQEEEDVDAIEVEDNDEDDDEEEEEEEEDQEIEVKEEPVSDDEDEEAEDQEDEDEEKEDDDEESFFSKEDKKVPVVKKEKKSKYTDTEYGVDRGIDFRNVDVVVNFDFPRSVKNYIHRIGRTARGDNKGIALSFISEDNDVLLKRVQKNRADSGYNVKPFEFKMTAIEGFRYRVEDVLNTVSKAEVAAARKKEIELEIINNDKLKSHFEANPKDLMALKHDIPLLKKKVARNLKYIPEYLLPTALKSTANRKLQVISKKPLDERYAKSAAAAKAKADLATSTANKNKKRKKDVLTTFKAKPTTESMIREYGITEKDIDNTGALKNDKKIFRSVKKFKTTAPASESK